MEENIILSSFLQLSFSMQLGDKKSQTSSFQLSPAVFQLGDRKSQTSFSDKVKSDNDDLEIISFCLNIP